MISHTEFANGVLSIWLDRSRWDGVLAAAEDRPERWSPQSRQAWAGAFRRWPGVKGRMVDCVGRSVREMIGLDEEGLDQFAADPHVAACAEAVARTVAEDARLPEWKHAVIDAVGRVDEAVERVPAWIRLAGGPEGGSLSVSMIQQRLSSLSWAGAHLKKVFSGRGYFQE